MSSTGPNNNAPPLQSIPLVDPDTDHRGHVHVMFDCDQDMLNQLRDPLTNASPTLLASVFRGCVDLRPELAKAENWLNVYMPWKAAIDAILTQCQDEDGGNLARFRRIELFRTAKTQIINSPTTHAEEMQATASAWEQDFKGRSAHLFLTAVDIMNEKRGTKPYSNSVTIVQSSGTGKSRMIDEASKYRFTIPLNLRPAKDTSGFPLADATIRDWLVIRTDETTLGFELRALHLLDSLFRNVQKEVDGFEPVAGEDFARKWRAHIQAHRNTLYKRVVENARLDTESLHGTDKERRQAAVTRASDSLESLIKVVKARNPNDNYAQSENPATILLCFDESFGMTTDYTHDTPDETRTAYQTMCRVTYDLHLSSLFMVYLSTGSDLSRFSPSKHMYWSSRARDAIIDTVQSPIVEVPFDQWKKDIIVTEDASTLLDVCAPSFMARYGRPLFWTRWEHGSAIVREDLVKFAWAKLTGMPEPNSMELPTNSGDDALAAISVRILLSFEPARETLMRMENRLVQGHMRVVYSVPAHREYMRSGTPSEPLLAEAAARHMQRISVPNVLAMFLDHTLISKGERGEVVARMLLTLAHDAAITSQASDPLDLNVGSSVFSVPVKVLDFITALVGKQHATTVFDSIPDNIRAPKDLNPVKFREAFRDAVVHFTHFGKARNKSVISDEGAWIAMARGMAWQCYDQHADIDIVIPVLMGDGNRLGRFVMSAIFIQIKNRYRGVQVNIDGKSFFTKHATRSEEQHHPYATIVMELGIESPSVPQEEPKVAVEEKRPSRAEVEVGGSGERVYQPRSAKNPPPTHSRYSIRIRGCSHSVYSVIRPGDEALFDEMLAAKSLIGEHPRQLPMFLEAIQRMKPTWCEGQMLDYVRPVDIKGLSTITAPPSTPVLPIFKEEGVSAGFFVDVNNP